MMKRDVALTYEPINTVDLSEKVAAPSCGGEVSFVGAVRDHTGDKQVTHLFYESYELMALKELNKIVDAAFEKWDIQGCAVHHRLGELKIGEIAVAIVVTATHRAACFEACRFIIETLKKDVPIWKKEYFEGGEEWISPRP